MVFAIVKSLTTSGHLAARILSLETAFRPDRPVPQGEAAAMTN